MPLEILPFANLSVGAEEISRNKTFMISQTSTAMKRAEIPSG